MIVFTVSERTSPGRVRTRRGLTKWTREYRDGGFEAGAVDVDTDLVADLARDQLVDGLSLVMSPTVVTETRHRAT